jgi:ABC-type amino acid transport substrate-binding protein
MGDIIFKSGAYYLETKMFIKKTQIIKNIKISRKLHSSYIIVICSLLFLAFLSSCAPAPQGGAAAPVPSPFASFRDIPGITAEEIADIEALQREYRSFSFAGIPNTEAFIKENGDVGGYNALLCEWLTELFGIPFQLQVILFDNVLAELNRTIDFTGTLGATEERLSRYNMTGPIAERQLKIMRLKGSHPMEQIAKERLPRYALVLGSNNRNLVSAASQPGTYEIVDVNNIEEAYQALLDGRADAYFGPNVTVDFFPADDVYTEDFFPLIFTQVSMTTANPALAPIV